MGGRFGKHGDAKCKAQISTVKINVAEMIMKRVLLRVDSN